MPAERSGGVRKTSPSSCPNCHGAPTKLEVSSLMATVDYQWCMDCTHVWCTNRADGSFLKHVPPSNNVERGFRR